MLRRFSLPPDNAPDDTETRAFQGYGHGTGLVGFFNMRQALMVGAVFVALVLVGLGVWLILPESNPEYRVVPNPNVFPASTGDPLAQLPSAIPQTVADQVSLTIPTRVDQALLVGASRLYAFNATAGLSWRVRIIGSAGLTLSVSIYGPDGALLDSVNAQSQAEFTLSISVTGVYTIIISDILGTGGNYTLQILPIL